MSAITVHFALSHEVQVVEAQDGIEALKAAGRPDACLIERVNASTLEATFDPDAPMIISFHLRDGQGNTNDHIQRALACVAQFLNAARAGAQEAIV